jgi:hypothetical protein
MIKDFINLFNERVEKIRYELSIPEGRMSKKALEKHLQRRAALIKKINHSIAAVLLLSILQPTIALGYGIRGAIPMLEGGIISIPKENVVEVPPLPGDYDILGVVEVGPTYEYEFKMGVTTLYWDKVAYCETRNDRTHPLGNWQNGGRFAGGLGIMTSGTFGKSGEKIGTWERWGGEEFAPSPDKAPKLEQVVVANRIAIHGWQTEVTRDPEFAKRKGVPVKYTWSRPGIGYYGWGCVKGTVGPSKQRTEFSVQLPKSKEFYCPEFESLFYKYGLPVKMFSYIAWLESRCNTAYADLDGGRGLFDIDPARWAAAMTELGLTEADLYDVTSNVRVVAWITLNTKERMNNWAPQAL